VGQVDVWELWFIFSQATSCYSLSRLLYPPNSSVLGKKICWEDPSLTLLMSFSSVGLALDYFIIIFYRFLVWSHHHLYTYVSARLSFSEIAIIFSRLHKNSFLSSFLRKLRSLSVFLFLLVPNNEELPLPLFCELSSEKSLSSTSESSKDEDDWQK
jgi:hypothetical protein